MGSCAAAAEGENPGRPKLPAVQAQISIVCNPLMCKSRLLNHVKEQEAYLQCGGGPQLLSSRDFYIFIMCSHISRFVFVVKLAFFSDLNFRAQITQRGLFDKAAEKLCPSPGKKTWMVLWLIEH